MDDTTGPLSVSFNCTHFGYALEAWELAFDSRGIEVNEYLDPNRRMVDFLLPESLNQRYPESEITVKVVSMIDIQKDRQDSIGRWLHSVSPMTETALYDYKLKADLFEWRDLAPGSTN
jgi:hypothetical protein